MGARTTLAIGAFCLLLAVTGCQPLPTEFNVAQDQDKQLTIELKKQEQLIKTLNVKEARQERMQQLEWRKQHFSKKDVSKAAPITSHSTKIIQKPKKVAGIYVSGYIAGNPSRMDRLIQLMKQTELNAMVIDIKNDSGLVTYSSEVPLVNEIGADRRKMIKDFPGLIHKLKDHDIYVIGRIVTFRDPFLAGSRKKLTMKRKDNGNRWGDKNGVAWVDPYKNEVRQYNLAIAQEAARLGVDEIQFDYVRFPDNGKKVDQQVQFDNPRGMSKSDLIQSFLREARQQLNPLGALVSADVFGLTTTTNDDMGIGQTWSKIAPEIDYISPMIYPSHYSTGIYGVRHPDLNPYSIVKKAVKDGLAKNKTITAASAHKEKSDAIHSNQTAIIRPWYQAFTATWVHPHKRYGKAEILAQIRAAKEQGVDQYLLWNPHCKYDFMK